MPEADIDRTYSVTLIRCGIQVPYFRLVITYHLSLRAGSLRDVTLAAQDSLADRTAEHVEGAPTEAVLLRAATCDKSPH